MSNVVTFLREHGDKGLDLLKSQFAIHVTRHKTRPTLVLLKYDQLNSPMSHPIVQECRGIVLDESSNWSIVVYPYQKFFNMREVANAAVIDWNQPVRAYEKIDGSLLTMYFSQDEWHVATSGVPDASGKLHSLDRPPTDELDDKDEEEPGEESVQGDSKAEEPRSLIPDETGLTPVGFGPNRKNFAELFWEVFRLLNFRLPDTESDRLKCYMFELATPQNIVLIRHKTPQLFLHGVRDLSTLQEESPDPYCERYGWTRTPMQLFSSKADFERDLLPHVTTLDGLVSEGYVICDSSFNRFKLKCPSYVNLALLHAKDGNEWKRLVAIVQINEGSEFLAYFPQHTELYQKIYDRYQKIVETLKEAQIKLSHLDMRELAAIGSLLPEWIRTALFVTKKSGEDFKTFYSTPNRYGMLCSLLDPNRHPPTTPDFKTFIIPDIPPPQPRKPKAGPSAPSGSE